MSRETLTKQRFYRDDHNTHCIHDGETGALIFVHAIHERNVETTVQAVIAKLNDSGYNAAIEDAARIADAIGKRNDLDCSCGYIAAEEIRRQLKKEGE